MDIKVLGIGCSRCKELEKRTMNALAELGVASEYAGKVQVVFYDVWKEPEPGRKYGIQLIPTQVFLDKTGKELFRHTGLFPKEELVEFLKKQGVR